MQTQPFSLKREIRLQISQISGDSVRARRHPAVLDSVDMWTYPVLSPAASRGGDTVINAGRILAAPRSAPGRRYITGRADSINILAAMAARAGWSGQDIGGRSASHQA